MKKENDNLANHKEEYNNNTNDLLEFYDEIEDEDTLEDEVVEYSNYEEDPYDEEYDYKEDSYDEECDYEEKPRWNRNKILIGTILIIIISLAIWLTPQFLNRSKELSDNVTVKRTSNINNDITKMKEAALNYYKENFLPIEKGEEIKITLQEMVDQSIITNMTSNYHKTKSYISLLKLEEDYQLEVKLVSKKTMKEKTYIVNNYSYCTDTYLCEKEEEILEEEIEEVVETDITKETEESYQYEYSKTVNAKLSNWGKWNAYQRTNCSTTEITCEENDFNCLTERKLYRRDEKTNTSNKSYQTMRNSYTYQGKEFSKGCPNSEYMKINGTYYKTKQNNLFTSLGTFKASNPGNHGKWIYLGRNNYQQPPSDSLQIRYVFVGSENSCMNCSSTPTYTYDMYQFQGNLEKIDHPANTCKKNQINKTVPIYQIRNQNLTVNRNEISVETACYESTRTRTITSKGKTDTKWSYYENQELLEDGYIYTGQKKKG